MAELWQLAGAEAARRIAAGEISSEALVAACLARIEARPDIGAWIWLEPDRALAAARQADARLAAGETPGPLHGVPVGIKDIIETADMPTQNGYRGHEGRTTGRDALCVAQLRDAGAVILGKTVTTELAVRTPGKTRNPVDPAHTPGGSSSGSAAAVRDGQVPFALGTQTGGSVIRPASFCGIHGFKPTFGMIARTGVTMQADWLDTVGTYGRSVEDVALLAEQMWAQDPDDPQALPRPAPALSAAALADPPRRPTLGFVRTPVWDRAAPAAQKALEDFAASLGADAEEAELPAWMAEAWDWHRTLQLFGIARHYGPLMDAHGDRMSESLRDQVAEGREIPEARYTDAVARRDAVHDGLADLFARYDALLCLPAPGAAPTGLGFTGDPVFNAFWTYAGTPCVTLPLLEADGMPLGAQLVAPRGADGPLLGTARWLEQRA